jgi:hypothetical protein
MVDADAVNKFFIFHETRFLSMTPFSEQPAISPISPIHALSTYLFKMHFNIIPLFTQIVSFRQVFRPEFVRPVGSIDIL